MDSLPDIHYEKPKERIDLDSVGISNMKMPPLRNGDYWLYPVFSVFIHLPSDVKGAHVSRLYESLAEYVQPSIEINIDMLEKIVAKILERNEYTSKAIAIMKARVFYRDRDRRGFSYYIGDDMIYAKVVMTRNRGVVKRDLGVKVYTPIACPCALTTAGHVFGKPYTHVNKAWLKLIISSATLRVFPTVFLNDLGNIVRPVNILKRLDEALMVKEIIENPMFLEDLVRKATCLLIRKYMDKLCSDDLVIARARSIEPLHEYQLEVFLKKEINELSGVCGIEVVNAQG